MVKEEEAYIIAYEMCRIEGYTGPLRDWWWTTANTPEIALEKFRNTFPNLVGKLCGIFVSKVIK